MRLGDDFAHRPQEGAATCCVGPRGCAQGAEDRSKGKM